MKLIFLFLPLCLFSQPAEEAQGWLLSSAKSGNTWVRYCIEQLTDYDTSPSLLEKKPPGTPLMIKAHLLESDTYEMNNSSKKLILLVRNYKELICRYSSRNEKHRINLQKVNAILQLINAGTWHYFFNLEDYDRWSEDKKLLIYYEDLIEKPSETLARLVRFLDGDPERVKNFMARYEEHKRKALRIYDREYAGSDTKGKGTLHHSKKLSTRFLQQIDDLVREHYPEIMEKYLLRYATD